MRLIDKEKLIEEYDRVHVGPAGGARKLMEEAPTVEAIPVDWLMKKADWCDKNNGIFVSGAIRYAVDAWREEQNNGIDKS